MISIDSEIKKSTFINEPNIGFNKIDNINIIQHYNNNGVIVLDNVLLENECDNIIQLIDNDTNTLHDPLKKRSKLCIKFSELSDIIQSRCDQYIPSIEYIEDKKLCSKFDHNNNNQYWCQENININWRLVKCDLDSNLNKHFDNVYVKSVDNKSIYTIMIYLNDSDGDFKINNNLQFSPKKGRVIFFNQNILHEGLINKDNIKYYIRSEIMYNRLRPIETENDKKAITMYNEAIQINSIDSIKASKLETYAFTLSPLLEQLIFNY
jgi:hypothetical protein